MKVIAREPWLVLPSVTVRKRLPNHTAWLPVLVWPITHAQGSGKPCPSPRSLCLAKNRYITFLKLATKVHSLVWPLLPPEADYQVPAIKILVCNQKSSLAHLINMSIKIKHLILKTGFSLLPSQTTIFLHACLSPLYPEAVLYPSQDKQAFPLSLAPFLPSPSISCLCPLSSVPLRTWSWVSKANTDPLSHLARTLLSIWRTNDATEPWTKTTS